ncbi:MAG: OsmC family protein, partial [Candidatus Eremiobacteraeota bacterium]|nr:OsmC family protein [Candidatus Eremiobacteraeota bacterium]
MPTRTAQAQWNGDLRSGGGRMRFGSGAFDGAYSFDSRFGDGKGTNPEELIAAAHAGCFSMATAAALTRAGYPPRSIDTNATLTIEQKPEGYRITSIALDTKADVPGIEESQFKAIVDETKRTCPVSVALASVNVTLTAAL